MASILGLFFIVWHLLCPASASQQCPEFGSSDYNNETFSSQGGIFMAVSFPSQCSGTVTAWNFCYSGVFNGEVDNMSFSVKLFVQRQFGSTKVYNKVPNSTYTFIRPFSELPVSSCISINLSDNEMFEILPNDIMSACVIENNETMPLHLNFQGRQEALHVDEMWIETCSDQQISTIDLSAIGSSRNDFLVLNATISANNEYRAGNNPTRSSPNLSAGTFLNTAFPAECDGTVTAWQYCYYTSEVDLSLNYTATVSVWKYPTSPQPQFTAVQSSIKHITLQPTFSISTIYCKEEELLFAEYFSIKGGDILGVHLPPGNAIPLLGKQSNYQLLNNSNTQQVSVLLRSDLSNVSLSMHLYVKIGLSPSIQGNFSNTSIRIHSFQNTSPNASTVSSSNLLDTANNDAAVGLGIRKIIGIAVAALIIIVALLLLVFMLPCCYILCIKERHRPKMISEDNLSFNNAYNTVRVMNPRDLYCNPAYDFSRRNVFRMTTLNKNGNQNGTGVGMVITKFGTTSSGTKQQHVCQSDTATPHQLNNQQNRSNALASTNSLSMYDTPDTQQQLRHQWDASSSTDSHKYDRLTREHLDVNQIGVSASEASNTSSKYDKPDSEQQFGLQSDGSIFMHKYDELNCAHVYVSQSDISASESSHISHKYDQPDCKQQSREPSDASFSSGVHRYDKLKRQYPLGVRTTAYTDGEISGIACDYDNLELHKDGGGCVTTERKVAV